MKIKELQTLLDSQPSVSANTYLVGATYIIFWILAVSFLVLSLGLWLESSFGYKIFLNWVCTQLHLVLDNQQRSNIAGGFATLSFFFALFFGGGIYISKMVLTRNHFIMQLEDWLYSNLTDIKKNSTKKRNAK